MEKRMMKGTLKFGSVAAATAVALALPATATATNGYQLIGVGAYQKGMGGAVTAAPQSAMTAVSNPAGMAAIGTRADFSMEAFMPERHTDFSASDGDKAESEADLYGVPSIGWTAPTSEGSDLYFGGGMYGTSGMGVDYGQTTMMPLPQGSINSSGPVPATDTEAKWDGYSNIQLWEMAPTLAWSMSDELKLGASLNISYQSVAFQQRINANIDGDATNGDETLMNFDLSRSASAFGYGISLGALYEISDQFQVGASYKSKQSFNDLDYQLAAGDVYVDQQGNPFGTPGPAGTYSLGLDLPQRLAIGGAWTPSEDLTVSADIKWINWSDTMDELAVKGPNGTQRTMDPGWDDQTVYALGANWGVSDGIEVRAGYNYAKSPIEDEDVARNLILPAVVESHYTVGAGFDLAGGWELDAHYMYVPEKTFTAPNDQTSMMDNGQEIALSETSFGINIGYRF